MTHDDKPIRRFEVELVDEVAPPPRHPPLADAQQHRHPPVAGEAQQHRQPPVAGDAPQAIHDRPRDYLDGFLAATPAADGGADDELKDAVIAALRDIFDPEIPVNIYDLGLIYGVDIADGHVTITMTLTTPHCPVAETMPGEVEMRVMAVPGVATAEVNLVWDPPWNPASMSDEARLELGML